MAENARKNCHQTSIKTKDTCRMIWKRYYTFEAYIGNEVVNTTNKF